MKTIFASAIALLAAGSLAASASAASLTPGSGTFTATGTFSLKKGSLTVTCTVNLKGHVTSGSGVIDTATFTGSSGLCSLITKVGTWTMTATAAGAATINGFAVTTSAGACGPGVVTTTISNTGVITFANAALPPDCQVSGSMQTTPQLTAIVP